MSTFRFRAKQGQVDTVCRLLTQHVAKPKVGLRSGLITITVDVPQGISKQSIDRMLFANSVPGAVKRSNKFRIVRGDKYDVMYNRHVENGNTFIWVSHEGKFLGKYKRVFMEPGCTCCSGYFELEKVN
jgi:hypothetical protein